MNRIFLISFFLSCFFNIIVQAQEKIDFFHKNYAVEQGLPENNILSITEDNQGFIWLATPNFLCRFDGVDFKIFQKSFDYKNGSSPEKIGKLYTRDNKLWMISKGGNLEYLDLTTEMFYSINKFNNNKHIPPLKTLIYENNQFLLGTENDGLYITDRDFNLLSHYHTESKQPLSSNNINHIFKDNDNYFWILTDRGINRLNSGIITQFEKDKHFSDALLVNNIHLMFATLNEGILTSSNATDKFNSFYDSYPQNAEFMKGLKINKLYFKNLYAGYRFGRLIATSGGGLKVINGRNGNILDVSLVNDPEEINCIYGSENGKIWVGSRRNGLYVIDPVLTVALTQYPLDMKSEEIWPICSTASNEVLLFSNKGVLSQFNTDLNSKELKNTLKILPDSIIVNKARLTHVQGSQNLLLITKTLASYVIDPYSRNFQPLAIQKSEYFQNHLRETNTHFFQNVANREILVVGSFDGLFIYDLIQNSNKQLSSLAVERFIQIDDNTLAMLFKNGSLGKLNMKSKEFVQDEFLKNIIPRDFEITSAKVQNDWLWVGTLGKGLYSINVKNGVNYHFSKEEGLPNDYIMGLEFSDTRTIWCSTNNGIFKLNFSKNKNLISIENTLYLNYKNGLTINVFNSDFSFHMGESKICFGSDEGILCLDSQHSYWDEHQSRLMITRVKANGKEVLSDIGTHFLDQMEFAYNENSFEFFFTSISRNVPENINYSYQLEGFDEDWVIAGDRRYASYTNLNPGKYLFKIKLTNENYIGAPYTTISIHIKQAFWQTIWFKSLVTLILIGIIYLVYRLRLNYILSLQRVKEEISADLHDDLGARLTTIHLLSAIHKQKFKDQPEVKRLLMNIDQEIHNSSEALHELVGNIKMKEDDMEEYFSKLRRYASETLDQANLKYKIQITDNFKNIRLSVKKRKDIFLILKELLNNIQKHAQASYVEILLDDNKKSLFLTVIDNGLGFTPQLNCNRNGIKNLESRVEKYGGIFQLNSLVGEGTKVIISIPFDHNSGVNNLWSKGLKHASKLWLFN